MEWGVATTANLCAAYPRVGDQAGSVRVVQESADYWGGDNVPWIEDDILSIFVHNIATLFRGQVLKTDGGGVLPWCLLLKMMSNSFPLPSCMILAHAMGD